MLVCLSTRDLQGCSNSPTSACWSISRRFLVHSAERRLEGGRTSELIPSLDRSPGAEGSSLPTNLHTQTRSGKHKAIANYYGIYQVPTTVCEE